jgi:pSer/pThr/pTyr-binding forkhead associated (FHA) protein
LSSSLNLLWLQQLIMTKSVDQVPFGLPILITVILLLLLAGLSILYGSLILIRRNRAEKAREEAWARRRTVVSEPKSNTATTQNDQAPDSNTFGILIVQASDDRAMIGRSFHLTQPITTLGRSPENKIPFPKDSSVSRYHARIEKREMGVFLVEIVSPDQHGHPRQPRFGTFVNQVRIMAEGMILNSGDILRLGKRVEVRYESEQQDSRHTEKTYPAFRNQNETAETQPNSVQNDGLPATREKDY